MDEWLYTPALLAQIRPVVTTPVTAFVASMRTEITRIIVTCVSTSNREFRIYHDDDNTGASDGNALWYNYPVNTSSMYSWGSESPGAGISVKPGGAVLVKSDLTNGITFSFYGVSQARGR